MSLTGALKKRDSVIRAFMDEVVDLTELSADWRRRRPGDSEFARRHLGQVANPPWSTLGQAIDLRLRYALTDSRVPAETVESGLELAVHARRVNRGTADDLLIELGRVIDEYEPSVNPRLPDAAEERLLRLCFVMAWFEAFYRNQHRPAPVLAADDPDAVDLGALMAEVPDLLRRGSARPGRSGRGWACAICGGRRRPYAPAPVDGYLIDIKSAASPARVRREDLRQLIGYVLLDYDDAYGIERAGFYLSRYGVLIGWEVPQLLHLLGVSEPLAALRTKLSERHQPVRERSRAKVRALADMLESAGHPEIAERLRGSTSRGTDR